MVKNEVVLNWLGFGFGTLSLICSLMTLFLVYRMKIWNGFLLILVSTSICQVLYDLNYMIGITNDYDWCLVWNFLDIFGGLSVALWTNILSFIIVYILVHIKNLDIFKNFHYLCAISMGPPLVLAVYSVSGNIIGHQDNDDDFSPCEFNDNLEAHVVMDLYYWGRISSIIFNIFSFFYIYYKLNGFMLVSSKKTEFIDDSLRVSLGVDAPTHHVSQELNITDAQGSAITTLVNRLKYYPLVQVLCRCGAAWDEFDNYRYSNFYSSLLRSICSPSTGLCYFIVFLIMQPGSYAMLCQMFCLFRNKTLHTSKRERDQQPFSRSKSSATDDLNEEDLLIIIEGDSNKLINIINTSCNNSLFRSSHSFSENQNSLSSRESGNNSSRMVSIEITSPIQQTQTDG